MTETFTLSRSWKRVSDSIVMGLSPDDTLKMLEKEGIVMTKRNYFYIKQKLRDRALSDCFEIAKKFPERHMERVNTLRTIQDESWKNYHKVKDSNPATAQKILDSIRDLQPFISAYEEASKDVIEHGSKDNNSVSQTESKKQDPTGTRRDEPVSSQIVA